METDVQPTVCGDDEDHPEMNEMLAKHDLDQGSVKEELLFKCTSFDPKVSDVLSSLKTEIGTVKQEEPEVEVYVKEEINSDFTKYEARHDEDTFSISNKVSDVLSSLKTEIETIKQEKLEVVYIKKEINSDFIKYEACHDEDTFSVSNKVEERLTDSNSVKDELSTEFESPLGGDKVTSLNGSEQLVFSRIYDNKFSTENEAMEYGNVKGKSSIEEENKESSSQLGTESKSKPRFSCDACSKSFSRKQQLKEHGLFHTGEKLFCEKCNASYTTKASLKKHIVSIHVGERPFTCNICNASFTYKSNLKLHMSIHTGEKPFTCNVCNKSFNQASHLKRHSLIHDVEKQFSCDICNKSFYRNDYLTMHMRTHSGEKPYACIICQKFFARRSHLTSHLQTHTKENSFSCNICNKSFGHNHCLRRHMRIHSGEKPHSCDICQKSFTRKAHLTTHIQTHANISLS